MKNIFLLIPILMLQSMYSLESCAEIYKNVDANGHITYSNIPSKGSTKLDLGFSPKSPSENTDARSFKPKMSTPSNFPRVDKQTQNMRDNKRKSILKTELDGEAKALTEAKKTMSDNDNSISYLKSSAGKTEELLKLQEKSKLIQADIDNHQNNIQLLQKELSATK